MRTIGYWALSHGAACLLPCAAALTVLVLALNNHAIPLPFAPNGALIQAAVPTFVGILAARLPYDSLGTLATAGSRPLELYRLGWLVVSTSVVLAPAAIHSDTYAPGVWPIQALGPSMIAAAVVLGASAVASYRASSVVALITGLAQFFSARPALTGGHSWLAHWWRGDKPYIIPVALTLLAIAVVATSALGPRSAPGETVD